MLSKPLIVSLILLPILANAEPKTKDTIQLTLSQDDLTKLCIYDNKFYSIGSPLTLPEGKKVICERQHKMTGMRLESAEWADIEQQ